MRSNRFVSYTLYFLGWTLAIVAAGAILGAISFPLVGVFTHPQTDWATLARSGAAKLGFLAFIWGPGTAIVLCFHRAWRERHPPASGAGG